MQRQDASARGSNAVGEMLFLAACLLVVLAVYAGLRVLDRTLRYFALDPWDVLEYLGLAERDAPAPPRRVRLREL